VNEMRRKLTLKQQAFHLRKNDEKYIAKMKRFGFKKKAVYIHDTQINAWNRFSKRMVKEGEEIRSDLGWYKSDE